MAIYKYQCIWRDVNSAAKKGQYYYLDTEKRTFMLGSQNYYRLTRGNFSPELWDFSEAKFVLVGSVNKNHEKKITFKCHNNTVVAKMGNKKGIAKCHSDDEFDYYTGCRIALDRLFGKEESKKKESEFEFKVGERVKIFEPGESYLFYSNFFEKDKDLLFKYGTKYVYGLLPEYGTIGIIRAVKKDEKDKAVYLIETGCSACYLVGEDGICLPY